MRISVNANHKSQITNHKTQNTKHKSQTTNRKPQIAKKQPPPFSWRRLEAVVNAINLKLSVVYEQPNQPSQATLPRLEMALG